MRLPPTPIVLLLGLFLLPGRASAQVVQTPEGPVEFVGLDQWSVEMIRDSMSIRAPGEPLGRCAAILQQIGFPTASSLHLRGEDGGTHVLVTVVEPHRADRVRKRGPFPDSLPDVPEWRGGIELFRTRNPGFQSAVQVATLRHDTAMARAILAADPRAEDIRRFWDFLDAHATPADRDRALRVLARDRNWINRAVAASILTGFGEGDEVWWSLMDAQRDPMAGVAATASQALSSLSRGGERRVDWAPALASIRHLLAGTNVFVLQGVLDTLVRTRISPDLAPALLADGGGDLLFALLAAQHPHARQGAHAFLVHLAGTDHGSSPEAWRRWARGLAAGSPAAR